MLQDFIKIALAANLTDDGLHQGYRTFKNDKCGLMLSDICWTIVVFGPRATTKRVLEGETSTGLRIALKTI